MMWSKIRRPPRSRSGMSASAAASSRQHYRKGLRPVASRGWRLNFVVTGCRAHHRRPGTGGQRLSRPARLYLLFRVPAARGRGYDRCARRSRWPSPRYARAAITSAWHGNDALLGVSARWGYQPNGESLHPHAERARRHGAHAPPARGGLARGSAAGSRSAAWRHAAPSPA